MINDTVIYVYFFTKSEHYIVKYNFINTLMVCMPQLAGKYIILLSNPCMVDDNKVNSKEPSSI